MLILFNLFLRCISLSANLLTSNTRHPTKNAAVEAIGKLKSDYPTAKLWILGKKNEKYVEEKIMPICEKYGMKLGDAEEDADVICWGFVSEEKKLELLSRTTALVFPSNREGWGIPISDRKSVV